MNSFKGDALDLARAVIEYHAPYHCNGDHPSGFECIYCQSGFFSSEEEIIHETTCATLIAKDLLCEGK